MLLNVLFFKDESSQGNYKERKGLVFLFGSQDVPNGSVILIETELLHTSFKKKKIKHNTFNSILTAITSMIPEELVCINHFKILIKKQPTFEENYHVKLPVLW